MPTTPTFRSYLPPSVYEALERPARLGGMATIEHVVLLMQENRSFDHYFGDFPGVRGFTDRHAVLLREGHGKTVIDQPDGRSHTRPFRLVANGSQDRGTDHSWETGHEAWADGWHDSWVKAKTRDTMGYYDQHGVTLYRALADTFTLCDAYHSSVLSETTSNRNYFFSGYTGFEPDGDRSRAISAKAHQREGQEQGYEWTSYPERLEAGGKTWKVYQEWDNFYDNNLEFFATFKRIFREVLQKAGLEHRSLYDFYQSLGYPYSEEARKLMEKLAEGVAQLSEPDRRLYDRGLRRYPTQWATRKALVNELRADIKAGTLPQVSYLVPAAIDSEHPRNSAPSQDLS